MITQNTNKDGTAHNTNASELAQVNEKLLEINDTLAKMAKIDPLASWASLVTGITPVIKLLDIVKDFNTPLKKELDKLFSNTNAYKKLGEEISAGIRKGMEKGIPQIKFVTNQIGKDGIEKTFETTMKIESPSKVMKRLGQYVSEGLGDGIEDGLRDVKKSMSKLTDAVEEPAKGLSKFKFSLGGITAVAGIVASLVGYFVNMMSTNEELSTKMEEIWAKITAAFQPVIDVVMNLFDSFTTGGEGTCSMMDTIASVVAALAETLAAVISKVVGFFQENGDTIMAVVTTIWGFISGIIEGAVAVFGGIFDLIVGIFTGNGEKIKEGFAGIWEGSLIITRGAAHSAGSF